MQLISSFLLFFLIEIYSSIPLSTIELAPKNGRKTTGPDNKSSRSHIKPRQTDEMHNFNIRISKNPSQNLRLRFDTGFKGIWLLSSRYDRCDTNLYTVVNKHKLYDRNYSKTYVSPQDTRPDLYKYMNEFLLGYKATDIITLLDVEKSISFLEVTKTSKYLTSLNIDGVIGLKYEYWNPMKGNIIAEICKAKNLSSMFSFYYPKDRLEGGVLTLCGAREDYKKNGTPHTVKEITDGTWELPLSKIQVGSFMNIAPSKIIIRTDFYNILGPEKDISAIYSLMEREFPGKKTSSQFDCRLRSRLPNLRFTIGDKIKQEFVLKGHDYSREIEGTTLCKLDFAVGAHSDYWSVGDGFIRKYYTIFDMEKKQVTMFRPLG